MAKCLSIGGVMNKMNRVCLRFLSFPNVLVAIGCRVMRWSCLLLSAGWILCWTSLAYSVVVSETTVNNTQRPADDPGWDNVGTLQGSTGVYLGNRWVLTANHVGVGNLALPSGTYSAEASSSIRVANPTDQGLTQWTDLVLFRLTEEPNVAPLAITSVSPPPGTEVTLIGNGRNRAEDLTYWTRSATGGNILWEVSESPTNYAGFATVPGNAVRWGTNLIERDETFFRERDADNTYVVPTSGEVITFVTEFDLANTSSNDLLKGNNGEVATAFESQAVINDSGGAVFVPKPTGWDLAGIIIAVGGYDDQPDVRFNSLYGNLTFIGDLSIYRDFITQHYVHGDLDDDDLLTVIDLESLTDAVRNKSDLLRFDFDRSGVVDQDDRTVWVEQIKQTYFGDSNLDGEFSTQDLVVVFTAGQYEDNIVGNSTWATGDWNGDGEFNSSDFVRAMQSPGFELGPRDTSAFAPINVAGDTVVAVVPEPTATLFSLLGILGLILIRIRLWLPD